MPTRQLRAQTDDAASSWDRALYSVLAAKELRSGSLQKTPDLVTSAEALSWAHGVGLSGRKPSAVTIGARIACLSSFYRFLIRMGALPAKPSDALERPKVQP